MVVSDACECSFACSVFSLPSTAQIITFVFFQRFLPRHTICIRALGEVSEKQKPLESSQQVPKKVRADEPHSPPQVALQEKLYSIAFKKRYL